MGQNVSLFVITGIMAAGKSTIAQALAERFERSAHVRGDTFRRSIVNGRVEMSPDAGSQAKAQLRLRYELTAAAADRYVEAGFTTVAQDVMLGSHLTEALSYYRSRPLALIVLCPSPAEVERRERTRSKQGYGTFTPHQLDDALRRATPNVGLWLDSTTLTVAQTVDAILDQRSQALVE